MTHATDDWAWREEAIRRDARKTELSEDSIAERITFFREVWTRTQERSIAQGPLFADILATLTRYDPVGIAFAENPDEYEPESKTIFPRLSEAHGVSDVARIVHEEFSRWFNGNYFTDDVLDSVAREIWDALCRNRAHGRSP